MPKASWSERRRDGLCNLAAEVFPVVVVTEKGPGIGVAGEFLRRPVVSSGKLQGLRYRRVPNPMRAGFDSHLFSEVPDKGIDPRPGQWLSAPLPCPVEIREERAGGLPTNPHPSPECCLGFFREREGLFPGPPFPENADFPCFHVHVFQVERSYLPTAQTNVQQQAKNS